MTEIEVSCLPKDLPEFIAVDLGEVELGGNLHLSDVAAPEGVELLALSHGNDAMVVSGSKMSMLKQA